MAGTIALTGTETQFNVLPADHGGTIVQSSPTGTDFDSQAGIAGDKSFFIELHTAVNVTAREHGITPRAVIARFIQQLNNMFTHPVM